MSEFIDWLIRLCKWDANESDINVVFNQYHI